MFRQSVKMAWKSISSNKMRSFLTMLGIIIGVMSLVVLVSLASGAASSVNSRISEIGSNLLTVNVKDDKGSPLKLEDIAKLAESGEIKDAAPVTQSSVAAKSSYAEESAAVYGTTGAYAEINQLELYAGRFLKETDIENHTNVAVINAGLALEVLGRMDVVGETVALEGMEYQVVGVLKAKDSDTSTTENLEAYVPYTSLIRLVQDVPYEVTRFIVSASGEETMDRAEEELKEQMLERFSWDEDAFSIVNQSAVLEAMESVNSTLSFMLGGIAGISLLVGGIGIMNIMLVSVTERTREIGIRKAIGAGRGTIMMQFLMEALMISLMGCAIGIGFSWIALKAISAVESGGTAYTLSMGVVWIAVAFSMGIGILFGIYPANKAARQKPIEALRYTG
ncbi:MAG: FtsX-like permease family protein [Dorea sp.]|jgi:putative ABC transport system permease protein|nr:FtsX-like permease family protein [Dorea sp.]MCI9247828.1 FtsX-like permease family protein [Dorea sp.]